MAEEENTAHERVSAYVGFLRLTPNKTSLRAHRAAPLDNLSSLPGRSFSGSGAVDRLCFAERMA